VVTQSFVQTPSYFVHLPRLISLIVQGLHPNSPFSSLPWSFFQNLCSTPCVLRQLTKLPPSKRRLFSRACVDAPSEADVFEVKLRDGDIVVVYVSPPFFQSNFPLTVLVQTDGFSDNVFPSEMVTICSLVARAGGPEGEQVQSMANRMVEYARQCMKSGTRVSPFERGFHFTFFFFLFRCSNCHFGPHHIFRL